MAKAKEISRRQFVASAVTTAALGVTSGEPLFGGANAGSGMASTTDEPARPTSSSGPHGRIKASKISAGRPMRS